MTVISLTTGTLSDVAGRSNHRTRNRQRYFPDNYGRDRSAFASGAGASVENFCANRRPGASQVNPAILVLMVAFLFVVIAAVIAITQESGKFRCNTPSAWSAENMYGGNRPFMPLKVNYAGVMPIIFAWALLLFPTTIVGFLFLAQCAGETDH